VVQWLFLKSTLPGAHWYVVALGAAVLFISILGSLPGVRLPLWSYVLLQYLPAGLALGLLLGREPSRASAQEAASRPVLFGLISLLAIPLFIPCSLQ
jgi:hypothetical protein